MSEKTNTSIANVVYPLPRPDELEKCLEDPLWKSDMPPLLFADDSGYSALREIKSKIDDKLYNRKWDEKKKYYNEFEHIHISSTKNKRNENIAFYVPLSRSYFKLWEIIHDFNIITPTSDHNKPWRSAHLAEGPGGFIEAVCKYREIHHVHCEATDAYYGITLRSVKKEIPGWTKAQFFLKQHPSVRVHYGADMTGNIYRPENIASFVELTGENTCDLVTADGGFDFSIDFNHQEYLSTRLIFSEITAMTQILSKGGTFVCKFFDTYERLTAELLWFLRQIFDDVVFSKPVTSRPANSEKYLICKGFHTLSGRIITWLMGVLKEYEIRGDQQHLHLHSLFPTLRMDEEFLDSLQASNSFYTQNQLLSIKNILTFIEEEQDTKREYQETLRRHINSCIAWCMKYKVPINRQCKYRHFIEA
jgi:23S rRNA U2552 (ribose-2'-O)-methylase RlmE/FtsJ